MINKTHFQHNFAGVTIYGKIQHNLNNNQENLQMMTHNKNESSILESKCQKFYRFPHFNTFMPKHVKHGVITGSYYRLRSQNSNQLFLIYQIMLLFAELNTIGYSLKTALSLLKALPQKMEKEEDKLFWRKIILETQKIINGEKIQTTKLVNSLC